MTPRSAFAYDRRVAERRAVREVRTVVAVRVNTAIDPHQAEVILERGVGFQIGDGHLTVNDANGDPVAAFAPGQWLAVKVDDKFSDG